MFKFLFLLCFLLSCGTNRPPSIEQSRVPSDAEVELRKIKEQEEKDHVLGQYVINAIYKVGAQDRISDAKKIVLARTIVRVANDIFSKDEDKKAFIAIIAIESGFNKFAQSPTGPKGLGQISKAAFSHASDSCGIKANHAEDVFNEELNLLMSACYYRDMLENNDGDQYMAMIAYNQGPNSDSVKTYSKSGSLSNLEVLKYVAKFTYLKKAIVEDKAPKDLTEGKKADKIITQSKPSEKK